MFGKLKSGTMLTSVSSTFLPYDWVFSWKDFLQRPTIALLLHRISHVAQCVYILTKALLLFILLLKIAYVELMVVEMEACTCVTYIAKSNNGSMEMTNHTSWSRLCTCVEEGWWKWNTPFMDLSPFYLDNTRTWLYYYWCSLTSHFKVHLELEIMRIKSHTYICYPERANSTFSLRNIAILEFRQKCR